jgi:hypothetical protein
MKNIEYTLVRQEETSGFAHKIVPDNFYFMLTVIANAALTLKSDEYFAASSWAKRMPI